MKNILIVVFCIVFFTACSSVRHNHVYVSMNNPIFITEELQNKKIALVNRNADGNFTAILAQKLKLAGFKFANQENADIIIRTNQNYFRLTTVNNYTPSPWRFGFGFGRRFGRFGGFGHWDFYNQDYYNPGYCYISQVAVQISIKNIKDYETILDLQSNESSVAMPRHEAIYMFNNKVAEKILEFLNDYQNL